MLSPFIIDLEGTTVSPEEHRFLKHPHTGGILLFKRNYESPKQLKSLVCSIHEIAGRKLLITVDHEGGRIWRFAQGFTQLPAMRSLGALFDKNPEKAIVQAKDYGLVMASELKACDVDISFAPVLDLDFGVSLVIQDRAFHRDPEVVVPLAKAFIAGMHTVGMPCVGKHFPGHGGCMEDSHFEHAVDNRPKDVLFKEDITPYRELIDLLEYVMPSHVIYPQLDPNPAGFSSYWLKTVLKGQLGFKGNIISDCLSMKSAQVPGGLLAVSQKALEAGCDLVICANLNKNHLWQALEEIEYAHA